MSSLEIFKDARLWRKVHNVWISEIYHALKPQVAGRFALSSWLPPCLEELVEQGWVAWSSTSAPGGRHVKGWAWPIGDTLPFVRWSIRDVGELELDLDQTLREALAASGMS